MKPPFMIYADLKSILVPEDNGKQNAEVSYRNKYQKHVTCNYGYKLVYFDDDFKKPYLGEDAVYNFITSIIKKSKYCTDLMKKLSNQKLVMMKPSCHTKSRRRPLKFPPKGPNVRYLREAFRERSGDNIKTNELKKKCFLDGIVISITVFLLEEQIFKTSEWNVTSRGPNDETF